MPSATAVIDVEALLAPIPGENPSGESLQYSGVHDEIREARRADDQLNQGDWKRELKVADWDQVVSVAVESLTSKTKDLQIAAWMAEALVNLHGFAGCRDALKVARGLHEKYWDTLYPESDEGDLEARANVMAFLDRQTGAALKLAPVTRAPGGAYSYIQWDESRPFDVPENANAADPENAQRLAELKQKAQEEAKLSGEEFRKAKGSTPKSFYEDTAATLAECWQEFQALDKVMDEKFGRQTPGLGTLKKSLEDVRTVVDKILKEKRALEPEPVGAAERAEGAAETGGAAGQGAYAHPGTSGPIRSRQDALQRLTEVAQFFRVTEPHSPVAYLVERAIGWGRMPLEAWLVDVVKDPGTLDRIRETLGIRPGENG